MSAADLEVVTRFYKAIETMDVQAALGCFHPEIVFEEAASLPFGGTHVGVPGFMAVFTKMMEYAGIAFGDYELFDGGERVIARVQAVLTSHATGAELEVQLAEFHTVTDGMISHVDVFYKDTKAVCDFMNAGSA